MRTTRSRGTARSVRPILLGLGALLISACATPKPVTELGLSRETPEATYAYFKAMANANQWAAEWSVFSPNFKRAVDAEVGRHVDLGDYITARQTIATNSTSEMQLLLNSSLQGVQRVGPNRARITISAGGRNLSPTMIRMTRWELKLLNEDEPASGHMATPGEAITVNADGSITVRVQAEPSAAAYLRTIPRDQIEGFAIKAEWYVDDFGGLGTALGTGAAPSGQPAAQPQPGAYAPAPGPTAVPSQPAPAPGAMGWGSPDG